MELQTQALPSLVRFYEAEARYSASGATADRHELLATLHPYIVLHQPASLPYGGRWTGREGFGRWLDLFVQAWKDISPLDPVFYSCGSETLISTVTMRAEARRTGERVEMPMCQIIRFTDDMPVEWRNYAWDTADLLQALGTSCEATPFRDPGTHHAD